MKTLPEREREGEGDRKAKRACKRCMRNGNDIMIGLIINLGVDEMEN